MDENRIEGAAKEGVGRLQDTFGAAVGDATTQLKGKLNEAAGKAQNLYGQAADQARDLGGQAGDWVVENPWQAVGVAAVFGLVIGLLIAS
jgi:ElaB/YqjD/DUF883 family membrane-anchored ribosome-binding protein